MVRSIFLALTTTATLLAGGDWNPKLAAQYLDSRQQEWFAWKTAQTADGTCVSCHTGATYLLARPVLRKALNEPNPTEWETKLTERLRSRAGLERKGILQGVQTIFGAMFIPPDDAASAAAFHQMWELQAKDGGLQWYDANLDPWETPGAFSWGVSFAARAVGSRSSQPGEHVQLMKTWLHNQGKSAPLHSRLAMLWAGDILTSEERERLIMEVLQKQSPDGGWTIESLGPWAPHPDAPPQLTGSHPYATAFAVFALRQSGAKADGNIARAQQWLSAHQDPRTGAWFAPSMNKKYPEGSMESRFMQDAATAFATLALLN
jgi:squalene-hopene/tetraprenyl-beta-curcumene cyclase